jgi:hypothetical protein
MMRKSNTTASQTRGVSRTQSLLSAATTTEEEEESDIN